MCHVCSRGTDPGFIWLPVFQTNKSSDVSLGRAPSVCAHLVEANQRSSLWFMKELNQGSQTTARTVSGIQDDPELTLVWSGTVGTKTNQCEDIHVHDPTSTSRTLHTTLYTH